MVRTQTKKRKEENQNAAEALLAMMLGTKKTTKGTRKVTASKTSKKAIEKTVKKTLVKSKKKSPLSKGGKTAAKRSSKKALAAKKRKKAKVVESKRKNTPFRLRVHNILKTATWISETEAVILYQNLVDQNQDLICAKQSMLKRMKRHGFKFNDVVPEKTSESSKNAKSVVSHPLLTKDTWIIYF